MKIIKIDNCRECGKFNYTGYPSKYICCLEWYRIKKEIRDIKDIDTYPDWCPLEDYKDEKS